MIRTAQREPPSARAPSPGHGAQCARGSSDHTKWRFFRQGSPPALLRGAGCPRKTRGLQTTRGGVKPFNNWFVFSKTTLQGSSEIEFGI